MKATIDKAGRVVIPRPIREKTGLEPGSEIEFTIEGFAVRIARAVSAPRIDRGGNRLIVRPSVPLSKRRDVDVAELIASERERWPL